MKTRGIRCAMTCGLLVLSPSFVAAESTHPVDVKNLSCKNFLKLADDIRPMLVAWVYGFSRAGDDSWLLDSDRARSFVSSVQDLCQQAPEASFRYKVLEVAKARKTAAANKP